MKTRAVKTINFRGLAMLIPLMTGTTIPAFASEPLPEAQEILQRTLEQARWNDQQDFESSFSMDLRQVSEELGASGEVRQRKEMLYRVKPVHGVPFQRLVEKDGQPLSTEEARKEDKREEAFARKAEKGKVTDDKEENRVIFDEDLVSKYIWRVQGREDLAGRSTFVLSFEPREGRLPVRNRMDYALNKAEGRLWVDSQLYEVARVEFELKEKVRLWWGIIGSISNLKGSVVRAPVAKGAWMPKRVNIYLKGRILFTSIHQRERLTWNNFTASSQEQSAVSGEP